MTIRRPAIPILAVAVLLGAAAPGFAKRTGAGAPAKASGSGAGAPAGPAGATTPATPGAGAGAAAGGAPSTPVTPEALSDATIAASPAGSLPALVRAVLVRWSERNPDRLAPEGAELELLAAATGLEPQRVRRELQNLFEEELDDPTGAGLGAADAASLSATPPSPLERLDLLDLEGEVPALGAGPSQRFAAPELPRRSSGAAAALDPRIGEHPQPAVAGGDPLAVLMVALAEAAGVTGPGLGAGSTGLGPERAYNGLPPAAGAGAGAGAP